MVAEQLPGMYEDLGLTLDTHTQMGGGPIPNALIMETLSYSINVYADRESFISTFHPTVMSGINHSLFLFF